MAITQVPFTPVYGEALVLKNLPKESKRLLDYGCGDGRFTRQLIGKAGKVYACDIEKKLIESNKKYKDNIEYSYVAPRKKLPYKDQFFDCILLMGVLEHVYDERETLKELHRVLDPGGSIYIYGIQKGLFGFLDVANLKFAFPGLHKALYQLFLGKQKYEMEFVKKSGEHMFGDFTEGKTWHTHYSKEDIRKLIAGLFGLQRWWSYSLFLPVLLAIEFVYASIFRKTNTFITKIIRWDNSIDAGSLSYCFVVKINKK